MFIITTKLLSENYLTKFLFMIYQSKKKYNLNWTYIPDHLHRVLIIGGSGSGKTNVLFNLIKDQRPDIVKTYLYAKDTFESKY